jgi:hypothetical protein
MGPPLMDDQWIYGSAPANVVATILEGRPNGMPAFRGKIPDHQAMQIAAYVRSMSGLLAKDVQGGPITCARRSQSRRPSNWRPRIPRCRQLPKERNEPTAAVRLSWADAGLLLAVCGVRR